MTRKQDPRRGGPGFGHGDARKPPPPAGDLAGRMEEATRWGADDLQQGGSRSPRPTRTEARRGQGPKTRAGLHDIVRGDPAG